MRLATSYVLYILSIIYNVPIAIIHLVRSYTVYMLVESMHAG